MQYTEYDMSYVNFSARELCCGGEAFGHGTETVAVDGVCYPLAVRRSSREVRSSRNVGQRRPGKPTQDFEAPGVQSTRRSSVRYRARLAKYFSTVASVDPSGTW